MNPRIALLVAAGLLLMIGLGFGLTPVDSGLNEPDPASCGSAFAPDDEEAESKDRVDYYASNGQDEGQSVEACGRARGDRKPVAYGATGLGVLAGLLSLVVSVKRY